MAKRKLKFVRDHLLLGICEYCNMQFSSGLMPIEAGLLRISTVEIVGFQMILELIVNVFFTQYAFEGVHLICRQCRVRKRLMVNNGKRCSTVIANCFSHVSILTWHLFPNSNCLVLTHLTLLFPPSARMLSTGLQGRPRSTADL